MASRTKSFFDQDHTSKARPAHWNRPSAHDRAPLSEASNSTASPKPPIPATSQAKSKLKAFSFVQGQQESANGVDKENVSITEPDHEHDGNMDSRNTDQNPAQPIPLVGAKTTTEASNTGKIESPAVPHANTFPSTPAMRLPLEDLIGNFDDVKKPEVRERSPEETIGWIPNSSSTLLTPNRKRKRARSSSPSCPTTSSQHQSAFFAGNGSQPANTTPEADPTADLWKRYGHGDGDGLKLPDFSHLLSQASPGPLETPGKNAGLRRWASTGNDWPSSKSKRRRTNGKTSISLWQQEQAEQAESGGKSKVAAMVEKIQESLATQRLVQVKAKPKINVQSPSSSSPLPDHGGSFSGVPVASPSPVKRAHATTIQAEASDKAAPVQIMPAPRRPVSRPVSREAPQASSRPVQLLRPDTMDTAPLDLQSKKPMPVYKRPAMSRTPSTGRHYPTPALAIPAPVPPIPVLPAVQQAVDEFGDGDFDMTADDLEELVSQVPLDRRPLHQIPEHPDPPPQQVIDLDPEPAGADDEFGDDDLDEDSFAQAEISATQAFRSPRKRSPRKTRSPHESRSVRKLQHGAPDTPPKEMPNGLQRYIVKQVVDGEYSDERGRRCVEKVLLAEDERTKRSTALTLRGSWVNTSVSPGAIIHVACLRSARQHASTPVGQVYIDDGEQSPLLITHPDHMLSATTVADSFDCIRKAVLQDRIKATGETSKPMVYGKILHEVFQQALSANKWDDGFLAELVDRTTQAHLEGLWELGMRDTVLAVEEVRAKMGELAAWARVFVAAEPSSNATVDDKNGSKVWMSISKLIAIEEHIWSPQYGLKGNIDATVQTTLVDHPNQPGKKLVVPFEVKTGRTSQSPAHRAQTALYTLLLSDRYDVSVTAGLLYYLESSSISRIAPPLAEIRQMIQQRNRLASYLHRAKHPRGMIKDVEQFAAPTQAIEESGLPSLLRDPFKCGRCYAQTSCFTFHALVEDGKAESAGMIDDGKKNHSQVWHEAVGHLATSAKDQSKAKVLKEWFAKWDKLLTFEEGDLVKYKKELWTMSSAEREQSGRCYGNLIISQDLTSTAIAVTQSVVDGIEGSGGKINRFAYSFGRADTTRGGSFAEGSQLTVGEPIVVSSEQGQWALANGYVVATSKHSITVAVDRKLGNARQRLDGFDDERNQDFTGIMTVGAGSNDKQVTASNPSILYRLDKDEFSNGLALVRNNLVTLMSSHPLHTKLRDLLIFGGQPVFAGSSALPALPPSQLGEMNDDQRAAVGKVLSAQDYALILGMPGTGKTTTIAHIIRALLAEDKSILLTSYTHTAVDNILLKVRDIAPPNSILRLGVPAKINLQVQEFCQLATTPRKTIDEIEQAYMGCRIVATTCMGTNHALFNRRAFDVCIVDEASQITLPTSLGPLLHARKFVLVGDHYQLPPLVQNRAALEGGLDVSLFRQLSEQHPEAVATLGRQYRMCEDIMSLSNALIYNGQLRCGSEAVARRTLDTPVKDGLAIFHRPSSWLESRRDPKTGKELFTIADSGSRAFCEQSESREPECFPPERCWLRTVTSAANKVVFAGTDRVGAHTRETLSSGKDITNQLEATLTAQIVKCLLALGVAGKEIGVITLYRSQLALLRQLFKAAGIGADVDIDSADRFQGRDKECIILSMVRSNEQGTVGDLLKDWRRVNVALTRARSKLIVLGSRRTLKHNDLLAKFLDLVHERGWVLELPDGADTSHTFSFSSQAASDLQQATAISPAKNVSKQSLLKPMNSPCKKHNSSPTRVLKESVSAGNRSPTKSLSQIHSVKKPSKVIRGHRDAGGLKARVMKEQIAMDIFEDLTADDF